MCILFIAINQHKDHPLIVAANRDEFHQRPTKSAYFWADDNKLLAGQDLQAGGTWLGINPEGQFAAITNIRDPKNNNPKAKTRGELVPLALQNNSPINESWLVANSDKYNPFNLIYSVNNQLYCFNSANNEHKLLESGFHAICNGSVNDVWPKMAKGEQLLEQLINEQQPVHAEHLFAIMQDSTQAPDELLPNTGVGIDWEKLLSSIFITSPTYGTRSTSILLQHQSGSIDFSEQSYTSDGDIFNKKQFALANSN
ncbi:NRDE family protein [Colwelliaceae bacterium BS250]